MTKTINYYRKNNYGNELEYIVDKGDADIIRQLTGQKTVSVSIRGLIRDLTNGQIIFQEVIAPRFDNKTFNKMLASFSRMD